MDPVPPSVSRGWLWIVMLTMPSQYHTYQSALEASAVGSVRLLESCAHSYQTAHPEVGYTAKLEELGPERANCLDKELAAGKKHRYQFHYTPGQPDQNGVITTFAINAKPEECGRTGIKTIFADESGVLRFENEKKCPVADANSTPLM